MENVLSCAASVILFVGFAGMVAWVCTAVYGEWVAAKKNKALARLLNLRADALENEKHD